MGKLTTFILSLFLAHLAVAQQTTVNYAVKFADLPFRIGQRNALTSGDSVVINTLKFYLSGMTIQHVNGDTMITEKIYKLIDCEKNTTGSLFTFQNPKNEASRMMINLGIDSTTCLNGAMGGDLDPTLGMYWTWQNGYINIKMEGTIFTLNGSADFEYHIGGYQYPFNTLQHMYFKLAGATENVLIFDIQKFLLDLHPPISGKHIMSPGAESIEIAGKAAGAFSISSL